MKKIASIVLALILSFSSFSVIPAVAEENNYDAEVVEAMEVLRMFDIIPDYYDYNVDITKETTRGDFASATAKLLGIEKFSGDGIYYYDVPQTHWAYDWICALTERGILNGDGAKMFYPNEPIKLSEAYKIILSALGYKEYASASGGFPNGYTTTATKLELSDGISSGEKLTLGDSFKLLYNAMKVNIMRPTAGGAISNYETTDDTVMSLYRDVYFEEGRVTGVNGITIDGDDVGNPESVVIDGEYYDNSEVDMEPLLGQTIEFFYKYDSKKDIKTIIWAKSDGKTDSLEITVDNDAKFNKSSFELTYYDHARKNQKKITLDKQIVVIYNGNVVSEGIDEIFNLPVYTARFVEGSGGDYDVAIVKAYRNIVVSGIDKNYLTVNNKLVPGEKFSLDPSKYNHLSLTLKGGVALEFDNIQKGYVLSVYLSKDEKYLEVIASAETATGTVNAVEENDNGYLITIGEKVYKMPEIEGIEPLTLMGSNVTAYIDAEGKVADIEISSKTFTAAYLIKAMPIESSDDGFLRIKLLEDNGEVKVYACAEKTKVDGVRMEGPDEILRALSDAGNFVPQVCLIEKNQEGLLNSIDTVSLGENEHIDTSLSVNVPYAQNLRWRREGYLGAKSVFNSSTVILSVPASPSENPEDYIVAKSSQVAYDTYVNAETYKVGEEIGFDDIILLKGYNFNRDSSAARTPVLVEKLTRRMNSDGEAVDSVNGYQGKAIVSFVATTDVKFTGNEDATKDIKPGMMVDFITDADGEVIDYKILYDWREPTARTATSKDINAYNRSSMGFVYNVVEGVVKFGFEKPGAFDQATNSKDVPVLVYDTKEMMNNISVGSMADAHTYLNEHEECSKIFMYSTYTIPYLFVIFN